MSRVRKRLLIRNGSASDFLKENDLFSRSNEVQTVFAGLFYVVSGRSNSERGSSLVQRPKQAKRQACCMQLQCFIFTSLKVFTFCI